MPVDYTKCSATIREVLSIIDLIREACSDEILPLKKALLHAGTYHFI